MFRQLFSLAVLMVCVISMQAQEKQLIVKGTGKSMYVEHTIAPKEGMYAIGRLYNVNPKHIASFNKVDLNKGLNMGEVIRIPLSDTNFSQREPGALPVYYVVGEKDGLMAVSNANQKLALQKLRDWNQLTSDKIAPGQRLIVGYINSKSGDQNSAAKAEDNTLKNKEISVTKVEDKAADKPVVKNEETTIIKPEETVVSKKEDKAATTPIEKTDTKKGNKATAKPGEKSAAKKEEQAVAKQTDKIRSKKEEQAATKPADNPLVTNEDKPITKTVDKTSRTQSEIGDLQAAKENSSSSTTTSEAGYFKMSFEQQSRSGITSKNETVTSGIFKTTSGWQDAKYYVLIDKVSPGTIVRLTNPDNNKAIYAKVLGEMNGIRQNQGLDIRVSNAGASALGVPDPDKFILKINY